MSEAKRIDLEPVAIVRGLPPARVIEVVSTQGRLHVVQQDGIAFDSELAASRVMLSSPQTFMMHPIETILGLKIGGTPALHITARTGENKTAVLGQLERFIGGVPGSRTIRDEARMIADELFTNGSKSGMKLTMDLKCREVIQSGSVEILAHAHAERLVLACRDSYGKLDVGRVLARLRACFERGVADAIHHGIGGAGIGSYMVFNGCASYYAGVEKDRSSIVAVVLPLGLTRDEVSELPKNIHLLSK